MLKNALMADGLSRSRSVFADKSIRGEGSKRVTGYVSGNAMLLTPDKKHIDF
jgi:hypothetical protein